MFPNIQRVSGAHTAYYALGTKVLFRGVKRPGREVYHSPPSSAEIRNEWIYTSAPSACLHGAEKENFTFSFYHLKVNLKSPFLLPKSFLIKIMYIARHFSSTRPVQCVIPSMSLTIGYRVPCVNQQVS